MMNERIETVFNQLQIIYLQFFNPPHLKKSAKELKVKQLFTMCKKRKLYGGYLLETVSFMYFMMNYIN